MNKPVKMLSMVSLVNPLEGMEKRKERRYIKGIMAHPNRMNTNINLPCWGPETNPSSLKQRNVTRMRTQGKRKLRRSVIQLAIQYVTKFSPDTNCRCLALVSRSLTVIIHFMLVSLQIIMMNTGYKPVSN